MKREGERLDVGDRIRVFGGYEMQPEWLAGAPEGYVGTVIEFLPGQGEQAAPLVELDVEADIPQLRDLGRVRGRYLVLELGHAGADWSTTRPRTHVELCDFRPEARPWKDRRQGAWVESHATWAFV